MDYVHFKPLSSGAIRYLMAACCVMAAISSIHGIAFVYSRIQIPVALEYRECAQVFATVSLLEGKNPYAIENQPVSQYNYGILSPLLVSAFGKGYGTSVIFHRWLSVVFLFASLLLFFQTLRKDNLPSSLAFIATSVLFSHLMISHANSPCFAAIARPDSLGLLLFMLTAWIPWRFSYRTSSLVGSCLIALLALFTKQYFILGVPLLAGYLFCFESKSKGVVYGVGTILLMVISYWAVTIPFETYRLVTFDIHNNIASRSFGHLIFNLKLYCFGCSPLLLAGTVTWGLRLFDRMKRKNKDRRKINSIIDWRHPSLPFFQSFRLSLPVVFLLGGITAIVLKMGWHLGNGQLYYVQLISPFLVWVVFRELTTRLQQSARLALILLVLICMNMAVKEYRKRDIWRDHPESQAALTRIEQIAKTSKAPYLSPPLLEFALRYGHEVYDTGQTEYYRWALGESPTSLARAFVRRGDSHARTIEALLRESKFDVVVVTTGLDPFVNRSLLSEHYEMQETLLPDYRGRVLQVWVPKKP